MYFYTSSSLLKLYTKKELRKLRKFYMVMLICTIFMFGGCKNNSQSENGIYINSIQTSIGAVGENTNDVENQSFKYTLQLTNNEEDDLEIISIEPILTENFEKLVLSKDLIMNINKIISKGNNLEVSGEIIFNTKGMSKEEILNMEPFVKEVKIIEGRKIKKSF